MIKPMLAKVAKTPTDDDNWLYEIKWNGVRCIMNWSRDTIRLQSRSGKDMTEAFPEFQKVRLSCKSATVDGEIVGLDADGKSVFDKVARRVHLQNQGKQRLLAEIAPMSFVAFDLLSLNGESIKSKSLITRKELLSLTLDDESRLAFRSRFIEGAGTQLYAEAVERGLEGIMAKKMSGTYREGTRADDWLKVKPQKKARCLVLGWKNGESYREKLGALYIAQEVNGNLQYRGKVGSGLTLTDLDTMSRTLDTLKTDLPTLPIQEPDAHWIKKGLEVEVAYFDTTADGKFVFPSFKGVADA